MNKNQEFLGRINRSVGKFLLVLASTDNPGFGPFVLLHYHIFLLSKIFALKWGFLFDEKGA
jgi:hypothetical protein